jgi:hypothetical protein
VRQGVSECVCVSERASVCVCVCVSVCMCVCVSVSDVRRYVCIVFLACICCFSMSEYHYTFMGRWEECSGKSTCFYKQRGK